MLCPEPPSCPLISPARLNEILRGKREKVGMQIASQGVMLHQAVRAIINPPATAHAVGKAGVSSAIEPGIVKLMPQDAPAHSCQWIAPHHLRPGIAQSNQLAS